MVIYVHLLFGKDNALLRFGHTSLGLFDIMEYSLVNPLIKMRSSIVFANIQYCNTRTYT